MAQEAKEFCIVQYHQYDGHFDDVDEKIEIRSKQFDAKMDAHLKDILKVIDDFGRMMDGHLSVLENESKMTHATLLRMEDSLKEKVDIHGD